MMEYTNQKDDAKEFGQTHEIMFGFGEWKEV